MPTVHVRVSLLIVLSAHCGAAATFAEESVDYMQQIKPILKAKCYACHGVLKQEAGLRLDTGQMLRRGGESGPVIAPGKPSESLLVQRVSAKDAADRMPPEGEALSAEQIELLQRWIAQGTNSPDEERPEPDPRDHWAFRSLHRPALPATDLAPDNLQRVQNPIDAFIERTLSRAGLLPRPAAAKHVVLRRAFIDLIGLPPTREELQTYLADESPNAYERVVDRLLNSPQYGERWGRHWMDVWRYSDWYGRRHVPDVWNSAPQVWRWRDWIVESLNEDKGYDRMLQEMLAADEIVPEDSHIAVATGYLVRNWYALNPNDWMRNTVEHTGKAFLGLTFNCAHCHDHKYDPISQEDYFRLRAFFEPIYVRQDRVPGEADPGPFQDYEYSTLRKIQQLGAVRVFDKSPDAPTWFYSGGDERNRVKERGSIPPGVPAFLAEGLPKIEPIELPPRAWYPGLQPAIQETALDEARQLVTAAESELAAIQDSRSSEEDAHGNSRIVELQLRAAETRLVAARAKLDGIQARIAADRAKYDETPDAEPQALGQAASRLESAAKLHRLEADVVTEEHALAVAEAKPSSDTERTKEIEAAQKRLTTAQTALDKANTAAADGGTESYTALSPQYPQRSTGRRRALAEWITSRQNPLTARVAVNHIWLRHFHAPLVRTVYDFGRNGAAPTHPELLDWLAVELIESGWSMKHLHRLIVTSEAYRRVTAVGTAIQNVAVDPENKLLWRMNAGRMEAEVVRDSLLHCGGMLERSIGGQPLENKHALTTHRRSIYYEVYPEDGGASPLSELFDAPNPLECYRRTRSIVPQQALALTNSELVHRVSREVVGSLRQEVGADNEPQFVVAAFERVLSRTPTADERQLCVEAINKQVEILKTSGSDDAQTGARESLVRALLNHNDFVTIR